MSNERPSATPSLETLAIHAGQAPDPVHGGVMPNIVLSTTFAQPEPGKPLRFDYSRSGNPTRQSLEACLAALEHGAFAFAFASGCAAATTLLHTLAPGDHVVCGDDVYGGTYRLFVRVMGAFGIETSFVDASDPERFAAAFTARTKLAWLESPTNPLLKLADIQALSGVAHARGVPLVVDNTFASPVLQQPLALGADVVLHSATKYLNGHSDVVGGALILNDPKLAERVRFLQNAMGAVPSPFDCYLVLRGLKTLPVRMERHVKTARELALRLSRHPAVERVFYPGLPDHPQHELGRRQMRGPGGMVSLVLEGGEPAARRMLQALRWFALAESLGGVESLAEHPALMTHASIPREVRESIGIRDGLIRLSIGLEHEQDLWADLEQALAAARREE
ncbi:MAG TPA: PLP-dependent aspartate aminotransferase family protein [Polyangiaceae bacterium]|nr:PLP-dependent aspartate aminotransferase family protein [Polyangiaceae bacterium]